MKPFSQIYACACAWRRSLLPLAGMIVCALFWLRLPQFGLQANYYYQPNWKGAVVLSKTERQPDLSTIVWGRNFIPGDNLMRMRDFSIRWDGWIRLDSPGSYIFAIDAVNPCALVIDGIAIITHGGSADIRSRAISGSADLTRGMHKISLTYSQDSATLTKLLEWNAHAATASALEKQERIRNAYALSLRWTPPHGQDERIPAEYFFSKPPSEQTLFMLRHQRLTAGIFLLFVLWFVFSISRRQYVREHLLFQPSRRLLEFGVYLLWCIPAGIIFLGIKGVLFVGFLYLTGRPLSVALKPRCFLLERVTLSIALSIVLFALLLSSLLQIAPLYAAFFVAVCLYAALTALISVRNWTRQRIASDVIGSNVVYGILLVFWMFVCLIASNAQVGMEQSETGDALVRIINHDVSYWAHKYSSILYDALIVSYIPLDASAQKVETPTRFFAPYAVPTYHARAVTLLAIQLYVMTAISVMSLFAPHLAAVVISALTFFFFSASFGSYTFFILDKPLIQLSHNYALVQYPNLFFAALLPLYGLWRNSTAALIVGFLAVGLLPASHPGYFIIIAAPIIAFPFAHYLYRRSFQSPAFEDAVWKHASLEYARWGTAAAAIAIGHGSFLREMLRFALKLPPHSPQFMVWGYIFLSQPQLRITFANFPTTYRLDEPLFPFWHPDNLSAMPFWLYLSILLLPYLYRTYKPLCFLLGSVYLVTIMYIARGLPIFYADNLLDVYQPLDVALHLSMLIGSYAALELLFYQQQAFHLPALLTRAMRIALLGVYLLLFINTCFTTTYVRRTFVAGAYMESLFHHNLNETMRQSSRLYAYAFRHLWR